MSPEQIMQTFDELVTVAPADYLNHFRIQRMNPIAIVGHGPQVKRLEAAIDRHQIHPTEPDPTLLKQIRAGIEFELEIVNQLYEKLTDRQRWEYVDGKIDDPYELFNHRYKDQLPPTTKNFVLKKLKEKREQQIKDITSQD